MGVKDHMGSKRPPKKSSKLAAPVHRAQEPPVDSGENSSLSEPTTHSPNLGPRKSHPVKWSDWIMVFFSGLLALFTLFLWKATNGMWDEATKQLSVMQSQLSEMADSRKAAETQMRAGLTRFSPTLFPIGKDGKLMAKPDANLGAWDLSPKWKNVGTTQAIKFASTFEIRFFDRKFVSIDDIRSACPNPLNLSPTGGGGGGGLTIQQGEEKIESSQRLSLEDAAKLEKGQLIGLVVQNAVFHDVFPQTAPHHFYGCDVISISDARSSASYSFPVLREESD
jgi:hypothetical protein